MEKSISTMADTFPADRETGSDPDSDHCPSHTVNQPMSKELVGQTLHR
jgi:hypothetical protein